MSRSFKETTERDWRESSGEPAGETACSLKDPANGELSTLCPLHVLDVLYTYFGAGTSHTAPCCPTALNKNEGTPSLLSLMILFVWLAL
ncbi:MAG: hypothetical protein QG633_614 [Patescibacteria group bacterium]|jgi:hypothetical protein|nr:hypothetical protein [Patescibacteria group bacterium]